jgi:hypothetical protein
MVITKIDFSIAFLFVFTNFCVGVPRCISMPNSPFRILSQIVL